MIIFVLLAFGWICVLWEYRLVFKHDTRWHIWAVLAQVFFVIAQFILFISALEHHDWGGAGVEFLLIIISILVIWWFLRRWKDRKKAMEMLGAKTRALRDKVVKKMRETTVPSPVRIPV
jgi:ABC-type transport system involved in cytochrome bd biosynthesis fused ATPase/permease subunit